ncbi:MAG: DNA translocase FtsK [Hungatella sp.]|nr:DNA translocase FtsK [Hungatella sp.]
MAQGAKKGKQTAKKPSRSNTKRQTQTKKQEPQSEFIRGEVLLIASFALAVLLFLSNFHLCGVAGDYLRKVQLGIFGMIGFVAPVLLFVGTCFCMSNQGNPIATLKMTAAVAGTLTLCGLAEMLFGGGYKDGQKIMDAFARAADKGMGGGLIGGFLAQGLGSVVGVVGTYLILLVVFIICCVCVTEKSLVAAVKRGGGKAYQYAREDADRRRIIHEERREERRRLREEQRVRGVNLDSTRLGFEEPEEEFYEEASCQQEYDDSAYSDGGYSDPKEAGADEVKEEYEEPVRKAVPETALNDMPRERREDVFTGRISLPPEYIEEDDSAPFDADDVITVQEALRLAWQEEAEAAAAGDWEEDFAGEETPEEARFPEPPVYEAPVREPERGGSRPGGSVFDRDLISPGEEPVFGGAAKEESDSEPPEYLSTEIVDDFEIPQETKRVVTSTGKIIENDTEALKKKLESRRKEIREEKGDPALAVAAQIQEKKAEKKEYQFPPVTLLKRGSRPSGAYSEQEYKETAIKLQQTLKNFGVGVTVTNISCGPAVTRYELHPEQGVKVSKIVGLADDIKLSLAAADIRIEAPIPGKSAVGIEVPNKENVTVYLREIFEAEEFKKASSKLSFAVGKDIGGQVVVTDIAKMPHLLIAGATGSGKSVCINTLIMSIIFKASPDDVKMIMVDPKVVELSAYNGIPHLLIPVVTDPKKASGALNWAVAEMMSRYDKFAQYNVRNLSGYNAKIDSIKDIEDENKPEKMPQIIIIIDELADLMMVSPGEVEDAICRLAQLARAAGIHLVIATQRPSVNVITGLIKANVPSRIAFAVSSGVDSRTIIDMYGAEKLLGKGDMLFYPSGVPKPQRVQGAFVSDSEVAAVVEFLAAQDMTAEYRPDIESRIAVPAAGPASEPKGSGRDEYFEQAGRFIIEKEKASIGMLQRMYKIGFNRAARIMDQLAEAGVVGEEEGTKPRRVQMTMEEFDEFLRQEQ